MISDVTLLHAFTGSTPRPHAVFADEVVYLRARVAGLHTLGGVIGYVREIHGLTQADLAELVQAHGIPWRREQVLRVESDQRELTAHEAVVVAHVLGVGLGFLYAAAGYPEPLVQSVRYDDGPEPSWPADVVARSKGAVHAYMTGDEEAVQAVDMIMKLWRGYESASGRPPSDRAERAKRATLWREYEADPQAFKARGLSSLALGDSK